ncbi:hypothetical protein AA0119_g13388 [Alternaria tenuissima]|uniref:BZIP domain-containing protein n=1 Tax=Alternaria tenuissima TaxID=119927 RepID=A0ABY0FP01_9PLEO|nr:hypothetical protein IG631_22643 [Alternaria alternata]RYN82589.1 hypothetical protein AA0119_g13388 [Alternaria tenuissima]RYO01188.1 hypothetical protein AA0121_g13276 [Alternaria tenuissima]
MPGHSSPQSVGRTHYFPATAPTPPPNMMRTEIRRPSVNFPQSGSASPIAQYSPYSQPASVVSSQYDNNSTQGQYGPMRRHTPTHDSRQGSAPMESERNSMIAMVSSNQSSVQLLTIQSQDGSLHNIQVETQTASKGADEKRRRNAGASARFRVRKKEKEREASISIFRLEQNVRDSNEDTEYYRSERDYWRSIAMQALSERHIIRPPSPRLRRVSVALLRAPSFRAGHGSEASHDGYKKEMHEEERNVRRRTSSYHPAIGPHHTDVSAPSHKSCGYHAFTYGSVNHALAQGHQYLQHQQAQFAGPQPTAKRPAYRDSFPPEANRYEHRS